MHYEIETRTTEQHNSQFH